MDLADVPSWYYPVMLSEIVCEIDRALICEWACCPDGCIADRIREVMAPYKRDQALLPNRVAESLQGQCDAGT